MPKASKRRSKKSRSTLVFDSKNYVWLTVSVLLIVVGFAAMYLDGQFLGVVSLTVSPILIVVGYGCLIYAILRRSDEEPVGSEEAT